LDDEANHSAAGNQIMKNDDTLMIRYMGADHNRLFVIQKGSGEFWSEAGWTTILDAAMVFRDHHAAQRECGVIQYDRHKGKPVRHFRCEVDFEVVGDEVAELSLEELKDYILRAVRIDVDTGAHGEGPASDLYLLARMKVNGLRESRRGRRTF
jgi:hypothetical protein